MPTNPVRFRLSEAARLFKAAMTAGLPIKQLTIDNDGRPVIVVDQDDSKHTPPNPWEDDGDAA